MLKNRLFCVLVCLIGLVGGSAVAQTLTVTSPSTLTVGPGVITFPLTATGGTGTGYQWSIASGSLPPDFTIRNAPLGMPSHFPAGTTGGLMGVAGGEGVNVYNFTLRVQDSGGNIATQAFTFTTSDFRFVWRPTELPFGVLGQQYSQAIPTAGGPGAPIFSLFSGTLPPGLSVSSAGVIGGTPTALGTYEFLLQAVNGPAPMTVLHRITVNALGISTNYQLPTAKVGTFYSQTLTPLGGVAPFTFAGTGLPPGLTVSTGGVISGTPANQSNQNTYYTAGITVTDGQGRVGGKRFEIGVEPTQMSLPRILDTTVPYATVGQSVNLQFGVNGGRPPYFVAAYYDQPGLEGIRQVNQSSELAYSQPPTGIILEGNPLREGNYSIQITAGDSASPVGGAERYFALKVRRMAILLPPDSATFGQPYEGYLIGLGGAPGGLTYSIASGRLPIGLTLDSATGRISGTAQEHTLLPVRYRITDTQGKEFELATTYSTNSGQNGAGSILLTSREPLRTELLNVSSANSVSASGGSGSYTYSIVSGALPPGKSLQPTSSGVSIVGAPTAIGNYSFELQAQDVANPAVTGRRFLSLQVSPMSLSGTPSVGNVTQFYSFQIGVNGAPGPTSFALESGSLPTGVSLSPSGLVSGVPSQIGQYDFTVTATSAGYTASRSFSISIYPVGAGPNTLTISGTTNLTVSAGVKFFTPYTVTGSVVQPASVTATVISGALPPGVVVLTGNANPLTGATQLAQLTGEGTQPGTYTATIRMQDAAGNYGLISITITISPVVILTQSLPNAYVGSPYTGGLQVRGGVAPYAFSTVSGTLPTGLTLDPQTGAIAGIPTTATAVPNNIAIRVVDANGASAVLATSLPAYPISFSNPELLPTVLQGVPYSYQLTPVGGVPASYLATGLPFGLTINNAGLISGTVTNSAGLFTVTVTARNASNVAIGVRTFALPSLTYSLQYTPSISSTVLGGARVGGPYRQQVFTSGGVPPYTVQVVAPSALPPGLELRQLSELSGSTPAGVWAVAGRATTPGNYSFRLRLTDSAGTTAERVVAMQVTAMGIGATSFSPLYGIPASGGLSTVATNIQLVATGASGPVNFALQPGASALLLNGLSLSTTGLLSGNLNSNQSTPIPVRLTSGTETLDATVFLSPNGGPDRISSFFGTDWQVGHATGGNLSVFSGVSPFIWSIDSGTLPPGVSTTSAGSSFLITEVPTTAGSYPFVVRMQDSNATPNVAIRSVTTTVTRMRVSSPKNIFGNHVIPPAKVGVPYSVAIGVSNGAPPFNFSLAPGTTLPDGLTLSAAGVLSGTPTESGGYSARYLVSDSTGEVLNGVSSLTIFPANAPVALNGLISSTLTVRTGTSFNYALENLVMPGFGVRPISFAPAPGSVLPAGVTITDGTSTQSAVLSGTAPAVGNYSISLLAADAQNTKFFTTITLNSQLIGIDQTDLALPPAAVGVPYSFSFSASGGTAPYVFQKTVQSSMPLGMSISSSGVLSGTPQTAGTFAISVLATDASNTVTGRSYVLEVAPTGNSLTVAPSSINLVYEIGNPAPTPVPVSVTSTGSALSWTATAAGGSWLSLSSGAGSTPGSLNAILTPGLLGAGTYTGSITIASTGAVNSPRVVPVTLSVLAPQPCSYSYSPGSGSLASGGGAGSFAITTGAQCSWTATTTAPWLTIQTPNSGTGSGTVSFTAQANTGAASRQATITVGGLNYTLTQFGTGCAFTLTPGTALATASVANGELNLSASSGDCAWTAASSQSWLTISSATSGVGSAGISFAVAANAGSASRSATITAGGQTFTVDQAGAGCSFSLSETGAAVASSGGALSVQVLSGTGCAWNALPGPGWITVTSGSPGSGNGSVGLSIAANNTASTRIGSVAVAGRTFSVTQAGLLCNFTLTPDSPVQPAAGGSGSVGISPSSSGCPWVASTNSAWISLPVTSGSGAATLAFTVSANAGTTARSGVITVAGQNITVNQSGTVCSYSLRSGAATVPSSGGSGAAGLITATGCNWTASSDAAWLTITSGASGSTAGNVAFEATPNPNATARVGTLTIGGQAFPVTQAGALCSVALSAQSLAALEAGGSSAFNYTTSASGCNPPVASYNSWITITSSTYGGTSGTVNFTVSPNIASYARSGRITVGEETFTVTQAASSCTYSLSSYSAVFGLPGGPGTVPFSSSALGCTPPVGLANFSGFIGLQPLTQNGTAFVLPYTVAPFNILGTWTRTGQILVNGQGFTVKQNSW